VEHLSSKRNIRVRRFSRVKVKQALSECAATTKYDIAVAIAKRFPELAPRLPRFRKPWMSEDYRMSIFDVVRVWDLGFLTLQMRRLDITVYLDADGKLF
jgi:hypothetical protein